MGDGIAKDGHSNGIFKNCNTGLLSLCHSKTELYENVGGFFSIKWTCQNPEVNLLQLCSNVEILLKYIVTICN